MLHLAHVHGPYHMDIRFIKIFNINVIPYYPYYDDLWFRIHWDATQYSRPKREIWMLSLRVLIAITCVALVPVRNYKINPISVSHFNQQTIYPQHMITTIHGLISLNTEQFKELPYLGHNYSVLGSSVTMRRWIPTWNNAFCDFNSHFDIRFDSVL